MSIFLRCLSAEWMKTRRTLYLLAVFAMPTILGLFNFLLILGIDHDAGYYEGPNGWVQFEHNTITFWALLVLPSLLVLMCAFMAHAEHDTKQWRRLMCLPLPRGPIYLAKMAVVMALMLLSSLILWGQNILWGGLIVKLRPELGLSFATIDLWHMLVPYLVTCLYALFIASIHLWFSMRVNNFVLSIGLGVTLVLGGFFLNDTPFLRFAFPWSLPSMVYQAGSLQAGLIGMAYGIIGWLAATFGGCLDFVNRDVLA